MTYPSQPPPDSLPDSLRVRKRPVELLDALLCAAYVVLGAGIAWTLAFGSARFHDTPAVQLIASLGVHWNFVALTFAVYSALLLTRWTRVAGWALGSLLFAYYLVSLLHSIATGHMASALAVAAAVAAVLSQISGLVRSMIAAEWRGE